MRSFFNEALNFISSESSVCPYFGSCQNCMSSDNLFPLLQLKRLTERALSTGEPWT